MAHYKLNGKVYFFDTEEEKQRFQPDALPITDEEAAALSAAISAAAFDALTYAEKRAAEYPPMADYLDAVVKGDVAAQQAYIDACLAVKAKYPKV